MSGLFDINSIRNLNSPESVFERLGIAYSRKGHKLFADCPSCGKARKFDYNLNKDFYYCFAGGCEFGRDRGGVIDLVMDVLGRDFVGACKFLGGAKTLTASEKRDAEMKRKEFDAKAKREELNKLRRTKKQMEDILAGAQPGAGTAAETYIKTRGHEQGIAALGWPEDLWFHPRLEAFVGDGDERIGLGVFPAMIAKGRDGKGKMPLLHRTFLQPRADGGFEKAFPDMAEDLRPQWNAKQMVGVLSRCERGVYLGATTGITDDPSLPIVAAEGIESTFAMATAGIKGAFYAGLSLDRLVGQMSADKRSSRGWLPPKSAAARPLIIACDNDLSPVPKHPCGQERAQVLFAKAQERFTAEGFDTALWFPSAGNDPEDELFRPCETSHPGEDKF